MVVGDLEDEREDAGLGVIQIQDAAQQERTHLGDGGADGMALFAKDIPEGDGASGEGEAGEAELRDAVLCFWIVSAWHGDAGEVTFDVGCKDRDADAAEGFRHDLQGDSLASTRGARDQSVTVGHRWQQEEFFCRFGDQ